MALILVFGLLVVGLVQATAAGRKKRIAAAYNFKPKNVLGGARFADNRDLRKAGLFRRVGVFIGFSPDKLHALYYPGFGHILTVAAARAGKGATQIVNALLTCRESCICIDPKAENVAITGHRRKRFGEVFVLNPFKILPDALRGLRMARFNPMDILDATSDSFHALCDKIAAALVWDEGREGFHFTTAARALVSGVIAALVRHGVAAEQNLACVARVISGDIFGFCRATVRSTTDPFIIQKLGRFAAAGAEQSREIMDVISTAITQLAFIGNAAIAESLSGSDFRFRDLKRKRGMTVFICLPLHLLDICDKYFRLILETALADLLSEGQKGKGQRVLAIIDEMAQLGPHMKSLENAMGMAAGAAGLQLWCVLQDLSQLKGMFSTTWETFIQNCGVTCFYGARDETTRDYVSKLSGTCEVISRSRNVSMQAGEPHVSDGANQTSRPLLLPFEVGQLERDEMITFVENLQCGPVKARRKFYFRVFFGGFRKNPYVKNSR
jgi:type IV secretion system protein VirD4